VGYVRRRDGDRSDDVFAAGLRKTGDGGHAARARAAGESGFEDQRGAIGAITYSFRTVTNPDDIIAAYKTIGLSEAELMSNHAEALAGAPSGPAFGGGRGRGQQMTEEQRAAAEKARLERAEQMKQWRTSVSMDKFKDVRKKFNDAGVDVRLLCYNMNVNSTKDDEIEYAFQLAKALGVKAISTSTQVSMAKRLAPFADKHQLMVGFHGHDQTDRPDEVSTEETFKTVMAASKYLGANLDIGHFTAANGDPVAFIEQYHDRITNLHLKDRKKNHGENVPWGQGDTPIKRVLQLLKDKKYDIPANIEFEYGGDPVAEVGKCLEYCRQALG
jgi:sugar phosphate isomerase/epimerase